MTSKLLIAAALIGVVVAVPAAAGTPLPNYTTEQVCPWPNNPLMLKPCVANNQPALDFLRLYWDSVSPETQTMCTRHLGNYKISYYYNLADCVLQYVDYEIAHHGATQLR